MLFKHELHDEFGLWPLAYIPYGGADFGEIRAVAEAVGDGDDGAFYAAWVAAADRMSAEADACLARGHVDSARDLYLRASAFYGSSFHPLYGAPVDPRITAVYARQLAAFNKGLSLGPHPSEPFEIPYGDGSMPGYFIPAVGFETEVRPLLILNNGYDSTMSDAYFATGVAASRRGYHCLLFDGPGQGGMLYQRNVPLRHDWEVVIRAVVDHAQTLPLVDRDRIALYGWSLGGYLVLRAATGEPRIAALVADPAMWGIADGFRDLMIRNFHVPADKASDLGALDQSMIDKADAVIRANPVMNWKIVRRGFWTHGVDNLRDFFAEVEKFTFRGRQGSIRCRTLLVHAQGDLLEANAPEIFDALTCPKTLMHFSAVEGADGHCEMQNRSSLNRRVLDWLDEQFR